MFLLWVYCYCEMMSLVISCVLTLCIVSFTNACLRVTLYWNDDHTTTKTHTMLQCTRWKPLVSIYNETLRLFVDGWMDNVGLTSGVRGVLLAPCPCVSRAFHSVNHTRVQRSLSQEMLDRITRSDKRRWDKDPIYFVLWAVERYFLGSLSIFPKNKNLAKFPWIC